MRSASDDAQPRETEHKAPDALHDGVLALDSLQIQREPIHELQSLLVASERIMIRLANARPDDRAEFAEVRSLVIDSGTPARLAEVRRNADVGRPAFSDIRPLELILVRIANGSPAEPAEFGEIKNAILDSALIERTRALRGSM